MNYFPYRFIKYSFFFVLLLQACKKQIDLNAKKDKNLISYVNPFIGTGGHGHTYPGATMPFGMMQLSPDTRLDGWDGCSGYHYSDDEIYGFSHTHLSGTGVSDYGDILLMPTNKSILNNGADGKEGYKSKFSHEKEVAEPGFYKVHLEETNIDVALTVSKRSGIHKYSFPSAENQFLILDLEHRDELLDFHISILNEKQVSGWRHSKAWATNQKLFYYIEFSHPIKNPDRKYVVAPKKESFEFINPNNNPVFIKIGISAVDVEGAKKNLKGEIGNQTFEQVKKTAQDFWEQQLEKIVIEDTNEDNKVNFYSSMYHVSIAPNLYQDVDGRYRGMDLEVHEAKDFDYYTVFSLWDTYRAAHPLYTIIEQEKTNDFINTFLAKYDEGGIMPIWDLAGNYTGCMIGYHAVPVIADAYLKGIQNYDVEKAFEAMKHSATRDKLGLDSYKELGFIPVEKESESVSKTLEYAYDDWTIAQMAKELDKQEDYTNYTERAQYYKNIFDPESQFMRGRFRNTWFAPFDPYEVNFNYTEANSWQYSFYVPQDIAGFTKLLGGKQQLENQLDELFAANDKTSGSHQVDITGLIGQYAHGNEPSHHMAYLYDFVNKPAKTQEKIRQILTELYTNTPDGISGNEDCGQMSAWYIFSSLGFYPVTPGSNQYIIGSPLFQKASINLENGKSFTIEAKNQSAENKYIKSVKLNGDNYEYSYLNHTAIMNGGNLVFEMTNQPSTWGTKNEFIPSTKIDEHVIVASPFIAKGDIAFKGSTEVSLGNVDKEAKIYYTLGDDFQEYKKPFTISEKETLKVYAEKKNVKSKTIITDFYKIDPNLKIELKSEYANQYNAGGNNALIDGIIGTEDFRTGTWQGYHNTDLVAIVDLGKEDNKAGELEINFLEDQRSWIFLPSEVEILVSSDAKNYKSLGDYSVDNTKENENVKIQEYIFKYPPNTKVRYINIIAKKLGKLPTWHLGYKHDGRSWLFVDEIQIK
ncbi:glycosyl hydrolase family 92 [Polaribacter vadi]|uniref:Glycosyl hydrolase family 92 n=1 Tax=Polaribacter vadi TaxID=1774273 RepID=A0A1B8TP16_9FLAO|nr:GH92 family glycosyl hydrolase [Polaribacter vadi]AOW18920.1 glycosyl hydrolase family 92 [Polaribacter vadi]OBY61365.1 glycosyl hydrolase family 92 [Polaribacter vadi]